MADLKHFDHLGQVLGLAEHIVKGLVTGYGLLANKPYKTQTGTQTNQTVQKKNVSKWDTVTTLTGTSYPTKHH